MDCIGSSENDLLRYSYIKRGLSYIPNNLGYKSFLRYSNRFRRKEVKTSWPKATWTHQNRTLNFFQPLKSNEAT